MKRGSTAAASSSTSSSNSPFTRPPKYYSMQALETAWATDEKVSEYKKLYSRAKRRLRSLREAGLEWTKIYQQAQNDFVSPSKLTEENLDTSMHTIARFLASDFSFVSAQRRKMDSTIEALRNRGYTFLTRENYPSFVQFMEAKSNSLDFRNQGSQPETLDAAEDYTVKQRDVDPDVLQRYIGDFVENSQKIAELSDEAFAEFSSQLEADDEIDSDFFKELLGEIYEEDRR